MLGVIEFDYTFGDPRPQKLATREPYSVGGNNSQNRKIILLLRLRLTNRNTIKTNINGLPNTHIQINNCARPSSDIFKFYTANIIY